MESVETGGTLETEGTEETEETEDLKKYVFLTYLLTDSLKARDASASKKIVGEVLPEQCTVEKKVKKDGLLPYPGVGGQ